MADLIIGSSNIISTDSGTPTIQSGVSFPDSVHQSSNWGGCKVTLSSNQSISTSGAHKVLWDTEIFDTLGEFASNKYTATYAGIYLITTTLDYADMGDQKDLLAIIYVNNSPIAQFDHKSSSANYESTSCTVIQNLSADDYVEVFTDHAHGSNRDVVAGERYSWFCVQRIA
jgi:hypothetical protein